MTKDITKQHLFLDFWKVLGRLTTGDKIVRDRLDCPLQLAVIRAHITSSWAATFVLAAVLTNRYTRHPLPSLLTKLDDKMQVLACAAIIFVLWLVSCLVSYGFLRLFTLLTHNLTTNLFKVRGQRLRLLNVYTSGLSFAFPLAVATVLEPFAKAPALIIIGALSCYLTVLLARAYNLIFHKSGWQGFRLLVGGFMVTAFVLCIGVLAIAAAISVIIFLVLVLFRPILHR